ncbi:MAG: D-alanyl-D-alanine carboxypeptidase/D-alanyl-D-alanine-endopeptidase, partial [Acidobacteriota bacterium]|nr:D-alanyl-D-alanine carboxypeptidase/D-alanyl-D-alanine-endopeptidase [Acidobacteriota bacterium]
MVINKRVSTAVVFLLLIALTPSALPLATSAQQQPQRDRRVAPADTASPSPTPTPSPVPAGTPQSSPTPAVTGTVTAATTRTLAELQGRIIEVLRKPQLAPAMVGVKVTSLETGKVLFEENAHKLLRPASNMKLYTVAAGLDRLSPDYRIVTSVYVKEKPDNDGDVKGDLIIYGRGDPSLSARFNNGDFFKGINDLAARIAGTGIKKVKGDLIGDESYFRGPPYGSGWEWEDLQWWYGAEVSSLTVNDNFVNLSVKPGSNVGAMAVATITPPDPLLRIDNRVTTSPRGTKEDLTVYRELASDVLVLTGSIALDDAGYSGRVAVSQPALLFAYLLRAALAERGVTISGKTRTISSLSGNSMVPAPTTSAVALANVPRPLELTNMISAPFSAIAAQTLKPSQNLYTELILRTLGTQFPLPSTLPSLTRTSEGAGIEVVKAFLKEAGINPSSLVLNDGSGLSRGDMVTPEATLQLLTYMRRHRYATAFRDALPIA